MPLENHWPHGSFFLARELLRTSRRGCVITYIVGTLRAWEGALDPAIGSDAHAPVT